MKKQDKVEEPLHRRVPQEMVRAWEKKHMQDSDMTLEWAHARISQLQRRRVNPNKVLIGYVLAVVVVCLVGTMKFFSPLLLAALVLLLSGVAFYVFVMVSTRGQEEEVSLQDEISKFEDHFEAIMLDGEDESKAWDKESRVKHLVYTAQTVLDHQENLLPAARRDESVSMERLMEIYGYYQFLKEYIEEYRASLENFGDYFIIPTPKSVYDTARAGLPEHILIQRATDKIFSSSRVRPS